MAVQKAEVPGTEISTIFDQTISDVIAAGRKNSDFNGVVDIGITFRNVHIDKSGVLATIFGRQNGDESSVEVKLATRINLEDIKNGGSE
ncbi:hypothetical protein [Rubellicoccus peritrichatus]|uniref:Uncharacterized protein n=1 Tax=Rubellicoccus peritrichatus TaxID=3080537 RepID=A0AAQ3QX62_9BACT|nr:hypothetical protein [Puniceicoccus sp. CR14]WOO42692.1 hypothetical protein RZN69_06275 [Puniceicoccus sp. CR14]